MGAVGAVAVAVAAGASGFPVQHPRLLAGAAWLPSTGAGELTLLDGSTAEVASRVQVAPPGHQLDAVQGAGDAYAVDRTAGSVRRIDPATFDVGSAVVPLPGAGAGLTVVAAHDAVYTIDAERGLLAVVDPHSLQRRGAPVTLSTRIDAGGLQVDSGARLWVLDGDSGDLVRFDGAERHVHRGAARPNSGALVLVDGNPVLVDSGARSADTIDPADGSIGHTTALDLRADDKPLATGSTSGHRVYVMTARGVLALCDLRADQCSRAVAVGGPGRDYGVPVEAAGRVFVPDYATGSVWIVDVDPDRVVASPKVLGPHVRFQLLARDGIVFFNDPASEQAGVIRLDGTVKHVAKYDPRHVAAPPTAPPSTGPSTPPSTGPPATPPSAGPPATPGPPAPTRSPHTTPTPTRTTAPTLRPTPSDGPTPSHGPAPAETVGITLSTTTATVGDTVALRAEPSAGSTLTTARWQFGDGRQSDGTAVDHSWTAAGSYQVSVTATFTDGRTATASATVTVSAVAVPQATLTITAQGAGTVTAGSAVCPPTCVVTVARGTPVKLTANPSTGAHLSTWGGDCTGTAATCSVTLDADHAASATFAGTLAAPSLFKPDNGDQFHDNPRNAVLYWFSVTGAVKYDVEIQHNGSPWQDVTTTDTTLGFQWPGDDPGLWRVTAIGPDGVPGTPSPFRSFSWSLTAINAFAGTWVHAGTDPRQAQITITSSSGATMRMQYCDSGTCSWFSLGSFTLVNQTLTHNQEDIEHPSIYATLAGGQLTVKRVFSGNRGTDSTVVMTR